jgi:hypothetical protein
MDSDAKLAFKGNSMHATAIGWQHVKLNRTGEHFIIKRPKTHICKIMMGTMYIEQVGEMFVKNCKTGQVLIIDYKAEGWGGKNKHEVEGYIYQDEAISKKKKDVTKLMKIFGVYSDKIYTQ